VRLLDPDTIEVGLASVRFAGEGKSMNPAPRSPKAIWHPFENGATLGQQGSEQGIIAQDDEHRDGARITLERDGCTAPFSITCGIYGLFVHTGFAADKPEALQKYAAMKGRLEQVLASDKGDVSSQLHDFVHAF
jgi:hypothetical protein